MGMKTFSLSADAKLRFFAGESVILSVSIAAAAYVRVSRRVKVEYRSAAYLLGRRRLEGRHCVCRRKIKVLVGIMCVETSVL